MEEFPHGLDSVQSKIYLNQKFLPATVRRGIPREDLPENLPRWGLLSTIQGKKRTANNQPEGWEQNPS